MDINTDNYELFLFQYMEGELDPSQRAEVEAFLELHPDLAEEMSLYDPNLRIVDTQETFPGVIPSAPAKAIPLFPWRRIAVAACLLALGTVGITLLTRTPEQPSIQVALNHPEADASTIPVATIPESTPPQTRPEQDPNLTQTQYDSESTLINTSSEPAKAQETLPEVAPTTEIFLAEVAPIQEPIAEKNDTKVIILTDQLITYVDHPEPEKTRTSRLLDRSLKAGNAALAANQTLNHLINFWAPRAEQLRDSISSQFPFLEFLS